MSSMKIPPYPLNWPDGQPRTSRMVKSQFRTSLPGAIKNVKDSLRRFAVDSNRKIEAVQVTSNASMFDDKPEDPGVAVWFEWDGHMRCIAVDRYNKVACNLQAIHHVIEARRTELRHAGIQMVRTSFKGFMALPPPPDANSQRIGKAAWWETLGVERTASAAEIKTAYKKRSRTIAGEEQEQRLLNLAKEEGLRAVGERA